VPVRTRRITNWSYTTLACLKKKAANNFAAGTNKDYVYVDGFRVLSYKVGAFILKGRINEQFLPSKSV